MKRYLRKPDHRKEPDPPDVWTALAQELVDDGILDGAVRKAHAALHAVLDKFQIENAEKIKNKRNAVLVVDGKAVVDLTQQ
ncbi:Uncharacterised protein [Escherichia coli]|uniref:Uncharacterized protein n=1 Tax=Escherichia coli TaxID=562 RepID=A0A2X1LQQ6_ECOLX|nr:Uncharacterised protein [Escherichia coli]